MSSMTPEHREQRLRNMNDTTSYVTSRGAFYRLQYEAEDAVARADELERENARLRAQLACMGG
jgi:hypothetical protein